VVCRDGMRDFSLTLLIYVEAYQVISRVYVKALHERTKDMRTAMLGSTVGSFADQPSARSPVTESTIERTNTRLVGPAGTLNSLAPAQGER
jgi:hypothetical protein